MLRLMGTGWTWLLARMSARSDGAAMSKRDADESAEISDRIRERYDTARKQPQRPTRQWLREHGVLDDWNDAWRTSDR